MRMDNIILRNKTGCWYYHLVILLSFYVLQQQQQQCCYYCNALFLFSRRECLQTTVSCGIFRLSIVQRQGIPGTSTCEEYCIFLLPDSTLECGTCIADNITTTTTMSPVTSPTTFPISGGTPTPVTPITTPSPMIVTTTIAPIVVSIPVTTSNPVFNIPVFLLVPVPVPIDVPLPVPVPIDVPLPVQVPIPVPVPILLPLPEPIPVPLPDPVPVPLPVPVPVPVPIPVPLPVTIPIPIPLPVPVSVPILPPVPVPLPVVVPVPIPVPVPIQAPIRPRSNYNIDFSLVGVTGTDGQFFTDARIRWESIITGELSNISTSFLNPPSSGCSYPASGIIDDIHICSQFVPIDGLGRVLGSAGPIYYRTSNLLPITGEMEFDSADLQTLKSRGNFGSVILHEIGHILGIGTHWEIKGVTGPDTSNCPYRGIRANAEYQNITGCSVVPTENDGVINDGTFCGHWDEGCLQSELMTGFVSSGPSNPLSRITIATLQDLGYVVDYSTADPYTRSNVNPTCLCGGTGRNRVLRDVTKPRRKLSDEAHALATTYGRSILTERIKKRNQEFTFRDGIDEISNDIVYVGDKAIMVFMEENGDFFDVIVRQEK